MEHLRKVGRHKYVGSEGMLSDLAYVIATSLSIIFLDGRGYCGEREGNIFK